MKRDYRSDSAQGDAIIFVQFSCIGFSFLSHISRDAQDANRDDMIM